MLSAFPEVPSLVPLPLPLGSSPPPVIQAPGYLILWIHTSMHIIKTVKYPLEAVCGCLGMCSVDLHTSLVLRIEPVAISWNYCTTELISAILLLLKNKWCLGWFQFVLRSGGQETN